MRWTAWDTKTATKATAGALLILALAWLVTALTDEGGLTWQARLGRVLPLAPACSAIGAWLSLAASRQRNELLGMEALGRAPALLGAAAVLGSAVVGICAGLSIGLVSGVSPEGFYPSLEAHDTWQWSGDAFTSGPFVVTPSGMPSVREGADAVFNVAGLPRFGRLSAACTTMLASIALPSVAVHMGRRNLGRLALVLGLHVGLTVVLFQAAGARVLSSLWAACPSLALLGALAIYGRAQARASGLLAPR